MRFVSDPDDPLSDLDRPTLFAPALCFEVLFPRLVATRTDETTVFISNPSDDSWVATPTATHQLARYASFRAVESHLPLVRVAHGGLTIWYDRFGRERESLPLDQYGSLLVPIPLTASTEPDRDEQRRAHQIAISSSLLCSLLLGFIAFVYAGQHERTKSVPADASERID